MGGEKRGVVERAGKKGSGYLIRVSSLRRVTEFRRTVIIIIIDAVEQVVGGGGGGRSRGGHFQYGKLAGLVTAVVLVVQVVVMVVEVIVHCGPRGGLYGRRGVLFYLKLVERRIGRYHGGRGGRRGRCRRRLLGGHC